MKLMENPKWIRIAGIIQAVNWGIFLFPTTLYLFYLGHYSSPMRIFVLLIMGTILVISIHSIRGKMNRKLKLIFLIFHALLIFQSVVFLILLLVLILMNGGIP